MMGWICSRCGLSNAPWVAACCLPSIVLPKTPSIQYTPGSLVPPITYGKDGLMPCDFMPPQSLGSSSGV